MEAGAKAYVLADQLCPWVKEAPGTSGQLLQGWLIMVGQLSNITRMRN